MIYMDALCGCAFDFEFWNLVGGVTYDCVRGGTCPDFWCGLWRSSVDSETMKNVSFKPQDIDVTSTIREVEGYFEGS